MFSILRGIRRIRQSQPTAPLSIRCRGKPISRGELFAYTNGHFLVNEEHQLARHYVKFDVDALCSVAAALGDVPSPVASVKKMEGGFSKALLMKKENGSEVVAKIPCRIAGPVGLITASEYAEIPQSQFPGFFRGLQTGTIPGVPLVRVWGDMTESEKLQLIQNLTKLEAQLSVIRFPAYGGFYSRDHLQYADDQFLLPDDHVDPSQSFGIGPSPDRQFDVPSDHSKDQGPCPSLHLQRYSKSPFIGTTLAELGTMDEQARLLEFTIRLMPMLDTHPLLGQSAQPTLWHTDLHMGNIYVAPDDRTQIVSVIDLQSMSVMPLFP
ncbi:hypothetical protein BO83DRAFT_389943 [Aspergillus eucalypticola CBS 122712]|uniref:Altered inheritance of mitochondria protein 9, mitochondrial n=1 Tax=Aspergillus eucalypticola (strain CBS 122712 / IBT 29274) TaxID=1448314 RepID=A0A317VCM6_ASPEC|nr:uncharacterized protein BO83DRAFT_389943 [Aspergillus eucalypticola CBS 122712]PWY70738.1 hypothetical protein BO83DRAFT_389943 [Aspergillus eucalypticola CBS 122712]